MNRTASNIIAVDVGGSKIAAALVDASGRASNRVQVAIDPLGGEPAIRQVLDLARGLAREGGALAVGVAVPAVVDPARRRVVCAPNIPGWCDIPLAERLEAALVVPALLEQDGLAAVVGEHWRGAARGARNVVMLIVGTGIGGGLILDGHLYRGSDSLAGCAAWLTRGNPEPVRLLGRRFRALDAVASGPSIARRAGAVSGEACDVFVAAAAGDARAQRTIDEAAESLGVAVADIVSLLNPDLVVIGGGVGVGGGRPFVERMQALVRTLAQPTSAERARVVLSVLGADAGLFGVAYQVFQELSGRNERLSSSGGKGYS